MPRSWHDRKAIGKEDSETAVLYRGIVADRKPYFMRYIYPSVNKSYTKYINNTNKNAMRELGISVDELINKNADDLSDSEKNFLSYYNKLMPVGTSDCVMNTICRAVEREFDGADALARVEDDFDYSLLKSGESYPDEYLHEIHKLLEDYNSRLRSFAIFANYQRLDTVESESILISMHDEFVRMCADVCQDEAMLCDIILDLSYTSNNTKAFAWSMCGKQMIANLLANTDSTFKYPVRSDHGEFVYGGKKYIVEERMVGQALC